MWVCLNRNRSTRSRDSTGKFNTGVKNRWEPTTHTKHDESLMLETAERGNRYWSQSSSKPGLWLLTGYYQLDWLCLGACVTKGWWWWWRGGWVVWQNSWASVCHKRRQTERRASVVLYIFLFRTTAQGGDVSEIWRSRCKWTAVCLCGTVCNCWVKQHSHILEISSYKKENKSTGIKLNCHLAFFRVVLKNDAAFVFGSDLWDWADVVVRYWQREDDDLDITMTTV